MTRTCTVCTHPERAEIDTALVAAGMPYRPIASQYGVGYKSVQRHAAYHLPASLVRAAEAEAATQAGDLLAQVQALQVRAIAILDAAEREGDRRSALAGIREARSCLELLAKLRGKLDDRPQINILLSAEWVTVQTALLAALAPFPDARVAAAATLMALGQQHKENGGGGNGLR